MVAEHGSEYHGMEPLSEVLLTKKNEFKFNINENMNTLWIIPFYYLLLKRESPGSIIMF